MGYKNLEFKSNTLLSFFFKDPHRFLSTENNRCYLHVVAITIYLG